MFTFKIHRAEGVAQEDFKNAVSRAKECIQSTLDSYAPVVSVTEDTIVIKATNLTARECKDLIVGCFLDANGSIYPEFRRVEPQQ